jgi:recombinational DNA repair ATPase RecF
MAQTQNQVAAEGAAGAAGAGLANQQAPLVLALENIGSLKEARVELIRGATVLYGLNGTGKTTVARTLRLLALMNMGVATAKDLMELINRVKKKGRIVYEHSGSVLEISCALEERGAWLKFGGVFSGERHVYLDDRLERIDRPRIALFWVGHDSVMLYGVDAQRRRLTLEALLTPAVFRSIAANIYYDVMDLYEEVLGAVNKLLETIDYAVEYRDGVYFKRGIRVYTPDEVSSGVRRFTVMLLAVATAERFAKYAKIEPVVFIENVEDSLDVTLMSAMIDILRTKGMISIVETHSGFPLRTAVTRRNMNYYVFADGVAVRKLDVELFRREIEEWSDLNAL